MRSLTMILSLLVPAIAFGQPATPIGPPPTLKVVSSVDKEKGQITIVVTLTKYVPVTIEKVVVVNGKEMTTTVTQYSAVFEQRQELIKIADGRAITTDGKQLPIEEVWKRVKANTVVAVSSDGNTPGQAYLRALNAETVILIPALPAPVLVPMPKKQ